ncbi:calnexin-like protein precursor [Iris pallida]|uniref:Calnexin-like protein n=1 Tax=Iris pallida TaxID=29817 RepID=A0AAX6I8U1_IRIPA|nr:calnexin-like protein precursor [Iris pallida]
MQMSWRWSCQCCSHIKRKTGGNKQLIYPVLGFLDFDSEFKAMESQLNYISKNQKKRYNCSKIKSDPHTYSLRLSPRRKQFFSTDDFDLALIQSKTIPDPDDNKPEDWDERAKIQTPAQ